MKYIQKVGTWEVQVSCSEKFSDQVSWLFGILTEIENSKGFVDGYRIQVGWTYFTLYARSKGFILCEPDFDRNPFLEWREDITTSLSVLAMQKEVLDKVSIEGDYCTFQDKIVTRVGVLGEKEIYLERKSRSDTSDSGWYIGPASGQEASALVENLSAIFSYELLSTRFIALSVLALPLGHLVVIKNQSIVAILNKENKNIWR